MNVKLYLWLALSFCFLDVLLTFDSNVLFAGMRDDWCFFCEFQTHVERASQSHLPFSPVNIISRLTNIGGTLGYGRQEDAHEFMRSVVFITQWILASE